METTTRIGMPLDEFLEAGNDKPFELINGQRRPKLPQVAGHSEVEHILFRAVDSFAQANQLGEIFLEMTFILPDAHDSEWVTGSRIPDLMFITAERLAAYKASTPDWKERPYALVPDLVVEVVSPTDRYSDVDEKVDLYLQDGVRLVWVLDPQRRKAAVHAPGLPHPTLLTGDAVLEGGDVLPGFQIALPTLFA